MKRIAAYLAANPRERKGTVELDLLELGIDFYHLISLLWERTTHKYTNEFLIWKTREIWELFINNIPAGTEIETIQNQYDECLNALRMSIADPGESIDTLFSYVGMEIDNYQGNNYGLTVELKIAILMLLLEQKLGITAEQIFEKYEKV